MSFTREEAVSAVDASKARDVDRTTAGHARGFAEMKAYFSEITHSNLDLVASLKSELAELRRREAADERAMYAIALENKAMSDPLRRVLSEVQRLRSVRAEYREDLAALAVRAGRGGGGAEGAAWLDGCGRLPDAT